MIEVNNQMFNCGQHILESDISDLEDLYKTFDQNYKISVPDLRYVLYDSSTRIFGLFNCQIRKVSKLVGVASLYTHNKLSGRKTGFITDVVIHKDYRSLGLGKYLLGHIEHFATCEDYSSLGLNCSNYNVGFYEKCGFRHINNCMRKEL